MHFNFNFFFCFKFRSHDSRVAEVHQELQKNKTDLGRGDSLKLCGNNYRCLQSRDEILNKMHSEAPGAAVKYTSIILVCYVIGMVLLLVHFVKQKYGRVRKLDIPIQILLKTQDFFNKTKHITNVLWNVLLQNYNITFGQFCGSNWIPGQQYMLLHATKQFVCITIRVQRGASLP